MQELEITKRASVDVDGTTYEIGDTDVRKSGPAGETVLNPDGTVKKQGETYKAIVRKTQVPSTAEEFTSWAGGEEKLPVVLKNIFETLILRVLGGKVTAAKAAKKVGTQQLRDALRSELFAVVDNFTAASLIEERISTADAKVITEDVKDLVLRAQSGALSAEEMKAAILEMYKTKGIV